MRGFGKSKHQLDKSKKTIWIHAASIGEFKSSNIIISKYYKDYNILVTTTTVSSANYISNFIMKKYFTNIFLKMNTLIKDLLIIGDHV